ncbi:Uma2 family endonuclease [Streptomyces sp. RKND-216]|uniref:Uma2 family endonuclease n=1 Tax=Streptomyces sp. RKND-216 TaxID=2562581 RepID=UPI001FFA8487|nr:Uma2 family endonuclease [Streptomyces sp. RKND-216]
MPSPEAVFTAEVVSSQTIDRVAKRKQYAVAGIPLYLLVDPFAKEITLFPDPSHREYRARHTPWGDKLQLRSRCPRCSAARSSRPWTGVRSHERAPVDLLDWPTPHRAVEATTPLREVATCRSRSESSACRTSASRPCSTP